MTEISHTLRVLRRDFDTLLADVIACDDACPEAFDSSDRDCVIALRTDVSRVFSRFKTSAAKSFQDVHEAIELLVGVCWLKKKIDGDHDHPVDHLNRTVQVVAEGVNDKALLMMYVPDWSQCVRVCFQYTTAFLHIGMVDEEHISLLRRIVGSHMSDRTIALSLEMYGYSPRMSSMIEAILTTPTCAHTADWLSSAYSAIRRSAEHPVVDHKRYVEAVAQLSTTLNAPTLTLLSDRVSAATTSRNADRIVQDAVSVFTETRGDIRAIKMEAFYRRVIYPEGTDWDAVREVIEHMGASELVDELFGAVAAYG